MVEILWKSNAPHLPAKDHELVELRLVDLGNSADSAAPRFLVREIHAAWSASRQQIHWNGYEDEPCHTRSEANMRFARRRATIVKAGFPFTTVLN